MAKNTISTRAELLEARVIVPHHIVHRDFPSETVVLNLQTGKYHGLNPTAGAMLEALGRTRSVAQAASELADAHQGTPAAAIEEDVCDLCAALLERGLIELDER